MGRTKKLKKEETVVKKDVAVAVNIKSRQALSKQLRAQQDALQSISNEFDVQRFLISSPKDDDNDEDVVTCPRCHYKMSRSQVIEGFDSDVLNHSTTCADCNHKFNTIGLIEEDQYYVWLCPEQTKDQFELWKSERDFGEDSDIISFLAMDRPEIVYNAYQYSDKDDFKTVKDAVENWLEI